MIVSVITTLRKLTQTKINETTVGHGPDFWTKFHTKVSVLLYKRTLQLKFKKTGSMEID